MRVYQEILPHSFLLILTDDDGRAGPTPLARALRAALRRRYRRVWVDCSSVADLSAAVLRLLQHGTDRLRQRGGSLVLCHPPASLRGPAAGGGPAGLCIAESLLDAEMV